MSDVVESILDGIKNLFVPSDGFIDNKVNGLKSEFSFVNSITDTVKSFTNFFTDTDFSQPPTFTINLNSAESKYDYGTAATAIDFTWYEKYKPMVDLVLSSIIWVVFIFNTFKDLPQIINGVGSGGHAYAKIKEADSNDT